MPSHETSLPPRSPGDDPVAGSPALAALPIAVIAAWTGATMLAGQIAWIRLAAAQVGCNLSAVVVLLTAAMVGLSIGSRLAAWRIERIAIGRRVLVQQFVAAVVLLVSPTVIAAAGSLAAAVARTRGWQYESAEIFAVAAVALAILLFNVPFGMLLPMAVEIDANHRFRGLSRQVGLLGASQLAGAAVGGVVLGLVVPMWVGFDGTLLLAGLTQLLLAAIWLIAAIRRGLLHRPAIPANCSASPLGEPRTIRRLAGLLGLLSLAAMLVWLRALSFYLGTSIYTFVLTAAILVGGLAVGGAVAAAIAPRQRRPGQFLAAVLLIAAVLLALAGFWADLAPAILPWVLPSALSASLSSATPLAHAASPFGEIMGRVLVIFAMIGPPAVLIGLTLPLLLRLAAPGGSAAGWPVGRSGRIVARVVASYTFGGALGAVLAFAGFLQMMDGRSALLAVAVGNMVAALWAEVLDPATGWNRATARAVRPDADAAEPDTHTHTRRRRLHAATRKRIPWPNLALFALAAAVCIWQAGQGSLFRKAYLDSPAGAAISEDELPAALLAGSDRPVSVGLNIDESRGGVVATRRNSATGRLELLVGQDVIADDSVQSIYVQRTQGLLPLLLAPTDHPRRALVVGLGSGASVAPLVQAGVERITVAEPFGAVAQFAKRDFASANDNLRDHVTVEFSPEAAESAAEPSAATRPTTAPAVAATRPDAGVEVRVIASDGRSVLRFEPGGWHIILVNPTDPSAFGAGTLFSEEFYKLAYDRLADDGIFVQWLPLWRMSPSEMIAVCKAFSLGFDRSEGPGTRSVWRDSVMLGPLEKTGRPRPVLGGFVMLGGLDETGLGRPMLALIGARFKSRTLLDLYSRGLNESTSFPADAFARRLALLRPMVDRITSRNRPSMKEVGLFRLESLWPQKMDPRLLLVENTIKEEISDPRPGTEFNLSEIGKVYFAPQNVGLLIRNIYLLGESQAEADGGLDSRAASAAGRSLFKAMELAAAGDRGPAAVRTALAAATQADPENSYARMSLDRMDCQAELVRVRAAWAQKKLTAAQAASELSAMAKRFPLDVTGLWMKFALVHETSAKDAFHTLEEILARAENSSAAHFWKARLLSEQAANDLAVGLFANAGKKVQQANNEKMLARALRNGETPADSALGDTIRAQFAAVAKGLAASQPAGK